MKSNKNICLEYFLNVIKLNQVLLIFWSIFKIIAAFVYCCVYKTYPIINALILHIPDSFLTFYLNVLSLAPAHRWLQLITASLSKTKRPSVTLWLLMFPGLGWIIKKWFSLTRAKGAVRRHSQAGFAMESVRSLIRVLAVLLRLFIKRLLYLEWMHSSKVSTVAVRWLKVFSRLPVVSLFQPNRVTSSFNEGE